MSRSTSRVMLNKIDYGGNTTSFLWVNCIVNSYRLCTHTIISPGEKHAGYSEHEYNIGLYKTALLLLVSYHNIRLLPTFSCLIYIIPVF